MRRHPVAQVALAVLVVVSALGVVYSRHLSRSNYAQLRDLEAHRDELQVEWGRLQLELTTYAAHPRVERIARRRLGMHIPPQEDIVVIYAGEARQAHE
jgi:cell division protein FtsL